MVLQCSTCIRRVWDKLVDKKVDAIPFPDEVIVEILSRLPADRVLKCRRVCRCWRDLTSTRYFADLQLQRSTPAIYGHVYDSDVGFIFDEVTQKDNKIASYTSLFAKEHSCCPHLVGSCNGFLLFVPNITYTGSQAIFIVNPITREQITLASSIQHVQSGFLCGMYFHRLTSEYKLLFVYQQGDHFQYLVRNVNVEADWQDLASFSYRPLYENYACPVTVNGCLHWIGNYVTLGGVDEFMTSNLCVNPIIVFSMDTETFHCMPHPGEECDHQWLEPDNMQLFQMKDHLAMSCWYGAFERVLDIWVLEDYAKWDWVMRYKVKLDDWNTEIKILGFQNDELLIGCNLRGLFWYNLEENIAREVATKILEGGCFSCNTTSYSKTLVTLSESSAIKE